MYKASLISNSDLIFSSQDSDALGRDVQPTHPPKWDPAHFGITSWVMVTPSPISMATGAHRSQKIQEFQAVPSPAKYVQIMTSFKKPGSFGITVRYHQNLRRLDSRHFFLGHGMAAEKQQRWPKPTVALRPEQWWRRQGRKPHSLEVWKPGPNGAAGRRLKSMRKCISWNIHIPSMGFHFMLVDFGFCQVQVLLGCNIGDYWNWIWMAWADGLLSLSGWPPLLSLDDVDFATSPRPWCEWSNFTLKLSFFQNKSAWMRKPYFLHTYPCNIL